MIFNPIARKIIRYLVTAAVHSGLIHRKISNVFFNSIFTFLHWLSNARIDINMMALPLIWMDKSNSHQKGGLSNSRNGTAYGPRHIGRAQSTETVRLPAVHYFLFENARISVNSSSVILSDNQVIIERAMGPDQSEYDFSSGHIIAHSKHTAIVRLGIVEKIRSGVFLGGNGSSNYYHWIVEILSKLEFIPMLPEQYRAFPLLISEDVSQTPSFKYTLDLLAKDYETIVLNKESSYVVDKLIYINSPNDLPFNLSSKGRIKCSHTSINPSSINYLRQKILHDSLKGFTPYSYPKKIFLCRKSGLRNYNQDEIIQILSIAGFTKVFMEDLHFLEQVRTVYHAEFIVGPTGAAWTNLIFCQSGAKGLCWMPEEASNFSAYSTIASIVGVDLRYLTYKAGVQSTTDLYSRDYYIDPNLVKQALSNLQW